MKKTLRHAWHIVKAPTRMAVGAVLVLIGILGLILPIMPGWIFIIPGLALVTSGTRFGEWLRAKARAMKAKMGRGRARSTGGPPAPADEPAPADDAAAPGP